MERSTRVDSEPRFAEKRKVIRDKKERFIERKGGPEMVVLIPESASVADPERHSVGRKSYERESQATVGDTRSAISHPSQRRAHTAWHANPRGEAVRDALDRVPGRILSSSGRPYMNPSPGRRDRSDHGRPVDWNLHRPVGGSDVVRDFSIGNSGSSISHLWMCFDRIIASALRRHSGLADVLIGVTSHPVSQADGAKGMRHPQSPLTCMEAPS